MLKKLNRKLKGLTLFLKVYLFIPADAFKFLTHVAELSRWIWKHKKDCKNDFMTFSFDFKKRETLYEMVINEQRLDEIDYLEFGVYKGDSFKWWMNRIGNSNSRFYGFDTFTGLPEKWGRFAAGDMNSGNHPPVIDDPRHQFYQGLFQQTFLPFLKEYNPYRRKVIHMDADIYSSTLYVLTLFTPYLKKGDIIFFDEFNVPLHEFKAFKEWTSSFYIDYKVLGGVNNFYQTAIMITGGVAD